MNLTQKRLKELLHYHPGLGLFTRLVRTTNSVKIGDIAGTLRNDGYVQIYVDSVAYFAHRLAWLYMTGGWPIDQIDHRNTIRNDNHWKNLREATGALNNQNQRKAQRHNKTGFLGVSPKRNSFQAHIQINGKVCNLGTHPTPELAYAAYLDAKRRLHPGCTL